MAMSKKDGGKAASGKSKAASPATAQAKKKPAKKG
jgi:hypothetical protein